jgi:hypothetical protein
MLNIGGGYPGKGDMAALGQPAKFSYCMAEAEEESPFEPLHTSRGYASTDSVVTVIGAEGPHSINHAGLNLGQRRDVDQLLTIAARAIATPSSRPVLTSARGLRCGVVVFNPLQADALASLGHTRDVVRQVLVERAGNSAEELRSYLGPLASTEPDDAFVPIFEDPDLLLIVVAGGRSTYGAVMPSVGFGVGLPVSEVVEIDQACDIFRPSGSPDQC